MKKKTFDLLVITTTDYEKQRTVLQTIQSIDAQNFPFINTTTTTYNNADKNNYNKHLKMKMAVFNFVWYLLSLTMRVTSL